MAVTSENSAPYAPASAVLGLIDRYRNRGLPKPIDSDVLGRAGISDSLIPRTLQAMRTLDLIDDDGAPTDTFDALQKVPEPEFKGRLAEWINTAYADVITFVDPAADDETKIRDAFRSYKPVGQQPRMVTLFLGLCAAAGLAPERSQSKPRSPQQPRKPQRQASGPKPQVRKRTRGDTGAPSEYPPLLSGLLTDLPTQDKGWTQADRDKFMVTMGVVLDHCYPIVENTAPDADDDIDEEDTE